MLGLLRNSPAGGPDTAAEGAEAEGAEAEGAEAKGTQTEGTQTEGAEAEGAQTEAHDHAASAERPSAPGSAVDKIAELADGSRTAGLPVTVLVEGAPQPLAEPVERAAHRVVQEALTNVHKHAPGATTQIHLEFDPRTVRVRIVNGPPGRPVAAAPDGEPLLPSGGHGLIGLTERVRLVGGTFESRATGDGGFRIDAALPTSAPGAHATAA